MVQTGKQSNIYDKRFLILKIFNEVEKYYLILRWRLCFVAGCKRRRLIPLNFCGFLKRSFLRRLVQICK